MHICIYGSASNEINPDYITAGELLGERLASDGHAIVFGGGANGMMGAVARGAKRKNGSIIGVSPRFFLADGVLYDNCTEMVYTDTMRERKKILEDRSDAFIITPGGVGTFDEFFEILTLRQLNQHSKPIVIYNINHYYDALLSLLNHAIDEHFIKPKNLKLFYATDSPDEMLSYLSDYRASSENGYR